MAAVEGADQRMSVLIIGEKEEREIKAAVARARANPIPWKVLQGIIPAAQGPVLTLENRVEEHARPASEHVLLPMNHRFAVSVEEQPAGLILHVSFSYDVRGKLPHPGALMMVLKAADLDISLPPKDGQVWYEEFLIDGKPGGTAINVAYLIEPKP